MAWRRPSTGSPLTGMAADVTTIKNNQTNGTQITESRSGLKRVLFTKANDDGTAIDLATGVAEVDWELVSVRMMQSGGAAVSTQFAIAETPGAVPPDVNTVRHTATVTAKGTLVQENYVGQLPCRSDNTGKLYLFSGRLAGGANDSTVAGVVYFRRAKTL